ncbi:TIGR04255 family protein [Streptomyces diastatochromogenes]|uniref:TIGR04255 family protein n=1 Tax=Streptomyces diastatochromogenes TaxID=42236 RepID=UPI00369FB2F2
MNWLADEPEDRRLKKPPLALVVCQVRHETEYAASDAARALKIKEALGWPTEISESVTQGVNVALGQSFGLTASQTSAVRGWQLRSPDGGWIVNIQPDHFAIETTAYEGWEEFKRRLEKLTQAVTQHVSPSLRHRVGLRFVNQIMHPNVSGPQDWAAYIGERIYQEKLYSSLDTGLRAAMQVIEVAAPEGNTLIMRHGFQTSRHGEEMAYVLDNDCSRGGSIEFDVPSLLEVAESLHKLALRAFEMGTSEELRKYLAEEAA